MLQKQIRNLEAAEQNLAKDLETCWSARLSRDLPDWFSGHGFWLNKVQEVALDVDDPRLTGQERLTLQKAIAGGKEEVEGWYLPISDPRVGLSSQVQVEYGPEWRLRVQEFMEGKSIEEVQIRDNRGNVLEEFFAQNNAAPASQDFPLTLTQAQVNSSALGLADLANLSGRQTPPKAVLLTTFDLLDDVDWLQKELCLNADTPMTLCSHPWQGRDTLWRELLCSFRDIVYHFPGSPHLSRHSGAPHDFGWESEDTGASECSIHSKLMLLEFEDRLRMIVSSANLNSRFWQANSEVMWTKDFPRLRGDGFDVGTLLSQGMFSRTLCHCLADVLHEAPRNRRMTWLATLSRFDLRCDVHLVMSRPGIFEKARKVGDRQLGLRLTLLEESIAIMASEETESLLAAARGDFTGAATLRKRGDCWVLCLSKGLPLAFLSPASCKALAAAQHLGFRAAGVDTELGEGFAVDLLATDVSEEDWDGGPNADLDGAYDDVFRKLPLLQATLEYPEGSLPKPEPEWWDSVSELFAHLEIDYGLMALKSCLAHHSWRQADERCFVALSSSFSRLDDSWFRAFDDCVGRSGGAADLPGPRVLVRDGGIRFEVASMGEQRLVEHRAPWHSPGRERLPNHGKLIARLCWDEKTSKPYGWVYVGSHNFTVSAWGTIHRSESRPDLHWSGNRELGVLLLEPRSSGRGLFLYTPLPFGLPLAPVSLAEREIFEDDWPEDQNWTWQQGDVEHEVHEDPVGALGDDRSISETEDEQRDWRLQTQNWWWWAA